MTLQKEADLQLVQLQSIKTNQLKDSTSKQPFTSRSFFLSSSLSAMRFLLSSSSFRASLVSVRNLSSFRILRIFLRPLRSSPSCCSSSSSPLCGNYTSSSALWSSSLREKKKNFLLYFLLILPSIFRKGFRVEFKQHSVCHAWPEKCTMWTRLRGYRKRELFGVYKAKCWTFQTPSRCWKRIPELWFCVASSSACNFSASPHPFWSQLYRQTDLVKDSRWLIQRQLHRGGGRSLPPRLPMFPSIFRFTELFAHSRLCTRIGFLIFGIFRIITALWKH